MDPITITSDDAPGQAPTGAAPGDFPALPPQYSTAGDAGFFNRQNESVPTAVTIGPDGATYVSELSALPYPEGYSRILRIAQDEGGVSFDGETPAGVAQVFASGFTQVNGLTFDDEGALYVLEYEVASAVYDPRNDPAELPPSKLVRVGTDGVREIISGDELRLANYVLAHEGKVYATINDADTDDGKLLAYERDADTGEWTHEVVADGLRNPRGLDVGPDGDLYILEQGLGTDANDPDAADAPTIPFIPGLVSERGGYTGAISKLDLDTGEVARVYEGLPSFREFNPGTGEDRVISIGPNGFGIAEDGTVFVASGGGLSNGSAAALGDFAPGVSGVLRLEGLFEEGVEPDWQLAFNSVEYAGAKGPDGATTLFNTQSNLNDIEIGADGTVYSVDAARNVLYALSPDGEAVEAVTVLQKTGPVLTPVQYALVLEAGGDPVSDYRVEINEVTFKGSNELPDTPGRAAALAGIEGAPSVGAPGGDVPPRGEDAAIGGVLGDDTVVPPNGAQPQDGTDEVVTVDNPGAPPTEFVDAFTDGEAPGVDGSPDSIGDPGADPETEGAQPPNLVDPGPGAPTETPDGTPINYVGPDGGEDGGPGGAPPFELPGEVPDGAGGFDPNNPPMGPTTPLIPGPVDPIAPPVIPDNPYAAYFEPFFGTYAPAEGQAPLLGGAPVDQLFVFGDRLTEDGGAFGKAVVAEAAGVDLPIDQAPYSPFGNFTDGLNWTTYLGRALGVEAGVSPEDPDGDVGLEGQDTNFSYLDATARELFNPTDPLQSTTQLTNFGGQIDAFEEAYGSFSEDDLVVVSFGGNDLTLPPGDLAPEEAGMASIQATIDGIARLVSLGAEKFLVPNLVNVEIVPIFSDPAFQEVLGTPPGFFGPVVENYNAALEGALATIEEIADVDITVLDTNALFDAIVEEPDAYGFVNVEEPVLITPPNPDVEAPVYNPAIAGQDPAVQHATLFLDVLFSPTALAQSIIAETARSVLLAGDGEDPGEPLNPITGTEGRDYLVGTDGADEFRALGGAYDRMLGGAGADVFVFGGEAADGTRDRDVIRDYEAGVDSIRLEAGAVVADVRETSAGLVLRLEGDGDVIYIRGEGLTAGEIDLRDGGMFA